MNAAVTGGTGFVGQSLVRLLAQQAVDTRVLVRRPEDDDRVRAWGAVPIRGDITADGGCDGFVRPDDIVIHAAARVDLRGQWEEFERTTVQGTRRLLAAALPHNPRRFVYVSSAAVYSLQPGPDGELVEGPDRGNLYGRAKLLAERVVRAECERAGCPWSIVRLGFVYGPGNRALADHLTSLTKRGLLYVVGDGANRIATLYVDDAARALWLAGTHPGASGRTYTVAGEERVTQEQFLAAMTEAFGLPRPQRHIGARLACGVVGLAGVVRSLWGGEATLNRAAIRLMAADQQLDATPIRDELGWRPATGFEEGVRRTREWYAQELAKR